MARVPDPKKSSSPKTAKASAGSAALAGYEYQIDVSVWLALDLMLANRWAQELVLEPASQEDVEADLVEHVGGPATTIQMNGYRLIVQAKNRPKAVWNVNSFAKLLQHGSPGRPSASDRLKAPQARYLLITSGALNLGVSAFGVRNPGAWPAARALGPRLAAALPGDSVARVAIIARQDEERLTSDIQRLLTSNFRVPNAIWQDCHLALREEARRRMLGVGDGHWTRPEVEQLIRSHDGFLAGSPELEHYIHPTNWRELRAAMAARHAALLIGKSGTGKTLATQKLYEELRNEMPGLARVQITSGEQFRHDQTPPPVLYDIEDPWGRYSFETERRAWNQDLESCFAQARPDRMLIATTRRDVAVASRALASVEPWTVALEPEHYGQSERRQLYRTRINTLAHSLQLIAIQAEGKVLKALETPLEIQKFFDALRLSGADMVGSDSKRVSDAISRSHYTAIESTVVEQIKARDALPAATVIWALLEAGGSMSLRALRELEEALADREPSFTQGVSPLVAEFIAARNLRQNGDQVSYYHPRVEAGVASALTDSRLDTRRYLGVLLDALLAPSSASGSSSVAAVVQIIAAAEKLDHLKLPRSAETQAAIDAWIAAQDMDSGQTVERLMREAAAAGSSRCPVSELSRFLLYERTEDFMFVGWWEPPERPEAWFDRLRQEPAAARFLNAFVRHALPTMRMRYPRDLSSILRRLAPPMSDAFIAAAVEASGYGVIDNAGAVAAGALDDLDGYEAVLDAAVEALACSPEEDEKRAREHLALINDEYSDEYAEYLSHDDSGYTAHEMLDAYVERLRATGNWRSIATHRHIENLRYRWLRELLRRGSKHAPTADEIDCAAAAALGTTHESMAWQLLAQHWMPKYLGQLSDLVQAGHSDISVLEAALSCLILHAPAKLTTLLKVQLACGPSIRAAEIAAELAEIYRRRGADDDEDGLPPWDEALAHLPAPVAGLAKMAIDLQKQRDPLVDAEALAYLRSLPRDRGHEALRRFRVALDRFVALDIDADIHWLLANTDNDTVAAEAVDAAAKRGMRPALQAALMHRYARAVESALRALASSAHAPLPTQLLELASSRSSRVRIALAELLSAHPHEGHLTALIKLADDRWSNSWSSHGEPPRYPIARAAADGISKHGALPSVASKALLETASTTADPILRRRLMSVLAAQAGLIYRQELLQLAMGREHRTLAEPAANALLLSHELFEPELAASITAEVLIKALPAAATALTLLWSARADVDAVVRGARTLAASSARHALIMLVAWVMRERSAEHAAAVVELLPGEHVARRWAVGDDGVVLDHDALSGLGSAPVIAAILAVVAAH